MCNMGACMKTIKYSLPCSSIHLKEYAASCNWWDRHMNDLPLVMKVSTVISDGLTKRDGAGKRDSDGWADLYTPVN